MRSPNLEDELMDVNIGEDVPLQVVGFFSCCCCMILKYGLDGGIDMLLKLNELINPVPLFDHYRPGHEYHEYISLRRVLWGLVFCARGHTVPAGKITIKRARFLPFQSQ